jgi:hypothetical protein
VPKFTPPQWAFDEVDAFLKGSRRWSSRCARPGHSPSATAGLSTGCGSRDIWDGLHADYDVVFVRDTAMADEPLWPFRTYPRASRNAYVRAALYQRALVNMMVGTGPCGWCQFSDAPYLLFKQLVPELPNWDHGQAFGWKEQAHLDVGEQYPWANPRQRLTWKDDTVENIRDEFNRFMESA